VVFPQNTKYNIKTPQITKYNIKLSKRTPPNQTKGEKTQNKRRNKKTQKTKHRTRHKRNKMKENKKICCHAMKELVLNEHHFFLTFMNTPVVEYK
jgi:esterase/lipase superfamily enzyme